MPSTWNVATCVQRSLSWLADSKRPDRALKAVFFPLVNSSLNKMFYLVSEKSEKLVVSLKIQIVNEMCNQRNNERSGDSTREIYNHINNWPDSSWFKFALIIVFSDNITFTRNAWMPDLTMFCPILSWLEHFKIPPARIPWSRVLDSKVGNASSTPSFA